MSEDVRLGDSWWHAHDEKRQDRLEGGHLLEVVAEGSGWRLYVNGRRRGFFDTVRDARRTGLNLADKGAPIWVPESPDNLNATRAAGRRASKTPRLPRPTLAAPKNDEPTGV